MKSNGEVVHCYTYRSLLPEEVNDDKEVRNKFDAIIEEKLGSKEVSNDFGEMGLEDTPTFDKYEDDSVEGMPNEYPEELEPIPYMSTGFYLNTYVILPQGDRINRGKVVRSKSDVDGNTIVRENQNPILDTRQYKAEFTNDDVTELTSNVIYERMYVKCDKYRNDMLLINCFVDYINMEQALSLQDQQLTENGKSCMKHSTAGWKICVVWKDESTTWEKLLYL